LWWVFSADSRAMFAVSTQLNGVLDGVLSYWTHGSRALLPMHTIIAGCREAAAASIELPTLRLRRWQHCCACKAAAATSRQAGRQAGRQCARACAAQLLCLKVTEAGHRCSRCSKLYLYSGLL
jgi:hypothetical protein